MRSSRVVAKRYRRRKKDCVTTTALSTRSTGVICSLSVTTEAVSGGRFDHEVFSYRMYIYVNWSSNPFIHTRLRMHKEDALLRTLLCKQWRAAPEWHSRGLYIDQAAEGMTTATTMQVPPIEARGAIKNARCSATMPTGQPCHMGWVLVSPTPGGTLPSDWLV